MRSNGSNYIRAGRPAQQTHDFVWSLLDDLVPRLRRTLPKGVPVEQVAFYAGAVGDRATMRPATPNDTRFELFADTYNIDRLRELAGQQIPEARNALQTPVPPGCFRVLFHLGKTFAVADFEAVNRGVS